MAFRAQKEVLRQPDHRCSWSLPGSVRKRTDPMGNLLIC
jgi:hypothetical protein